MSQVGSGSGRRRLSAVRRRRAARPLLGRGSQNRAETLRRGLFGSMERVGEASQVTGLPQGSPEGGERYGIGKTDRRIFV